jgi:8-oxo-dGTP pyrophosphatase MutT (NUDIX family)
MMCNALSVARPYVTTRVAAEAIGVGVSTLQSWAAKGLVRPAWRTAGGQARWDLDDLRSQLGAPDESADMPEPQPVVAAIVTSSRGVLISRRNDGVPPWGFITGEIEPGESPADAAVREVKEETGLLVIAGRVLGRRVHPATGRTMIYLAAGPAQRSTAVHVGDESELAEVRWASLAEAAELLPDMFGPVQAFLRRELGRTA